MGLSRFFGINRFLGLDYFFGFRVGVILAIAGILWFIVACAPTSGKYEIPLKTYTKAQQTQAAGELRDCRERCPMLAEMIDDYGALRKGIRAANGD